MPLYEYNCPTCQREFELLIRGDEAAKCPTCGSIRLERLLSVPAAHTAGSAGLPICEAPAARPAGGCGAPWCGTGGCGM